jgi:SSS family solute:Na+ symporter
LPGIAAYVLYKQNVFDALNTASITSNHDNAYPVLLNLLPTGIKGLSFAALTAAVVASLAGKANSIATIFTLDIYKKKINPEATDKKLVAVGKITVVVAMILGVIISPFLGIDKKGGFQFIQEYTGFVSPGIFAMFILGFFWKKASSNAALFATVGGFAFSVFFKFLPKIADLSFLAPTGFSFKNADSGLYEIPFLDRMGFVFVICIIGMIIISLADYAKGKKTNGLEIDAKMFKTSNSFAVGALIVCGILVALYSFFW